MGTEVLRPQDILVERVHVPPTSFHTRKAHGNLTNLIVNRKPYNNNNSNNKKISPKPDKRKSTTESKKSNGGLTMGQVTLLRRGESLGSLTSKINGGNPNPKTAKSPKNSVSETGRNGSESPEMVPKQIRFGAPPVYAGSAFSQSPSPRSVPLPSFFNNFNKKQDEEEKPIEDSATEATKGWAAQLAGAGSLRNDMRHPSKSLPQWQTWLHIYPKISSLWKTNPRMGKA